MLSAFYGLNTGILLHLIKSIQTDYNMSLFIPGMPYLQKHIKGPKWLPFVIGIPPLLMFSAASAAVGGYGLPNFTQLSVTSYYAASSASHYGISLVTRYIEETYMTRSKQQRLP
ncbi:hypothetical protein HanHA300_Chr14g0520571 [Helianthus annuus]|nr:hypothetical protein HanHA300_Chr14g0520571 [Helianthus annuus]KAJ0655924.1 hypothetical protein HanLR1_Chr14g0529941 [Helianthus annuus]KAJ0659598.1 hypothetical protein HanOQP8_Chr14g0528001 [Helianthus annuus]